MNHVILVGRVTEISKEKNSLVLAISKHFKNEYGDYEEDLIPYQLFHYNFNILLEIGDVIGISGRLQMVDNKIIVVGDHLTIISRRSERG